jgi:hypothetical protein
MSTCSFVLDECIPSALLDALSRPGIELDVAQVGDSGMPPKGASDSEILLFCEAQKRILVTADRKSFPMHLDAHFAQGRHTGGVFVIAPEKAWRLIYDDIVFIARCSSAEEWIDQMIFLPCFSA